MTHPSDVIVIGAGISGLVTAHRCLRRGLTVTIFDAAPRAGGVIGTVHRDGARYELGPNSTLDTTPLIADLLDALGLTSARVNASPAAAHRFIVRGGRLIELPTSPGAFLTTRAFSLGAKLRLLREPFIRPAPADGEESIAAFVRRRLGREFLDYAIDPFVAGIYAGDPEQISVPAAFPRLHALEQRHGSLIRGQIQGRKERAQRAEKSKNDAASFSFGEGMQTLTDGLARALPALRVDTRVVSLAREPSGLFSVIATHAGETTRHTARTVVIATPAEVAGALVAPFGGGAEEALRAIPYAPIVVVAGLYDRKAVRDPLAGFGFLVPKVEQRTILGTLYSSTMFPERAPPGAVLLTTFAGGRRNPEVTELDDEALRARVNGELQALLGAADPRWQRIVRWPRAIPQYTLGHAARLAAVERLERDVPGLYFRANYRGGVSVGDCIKAAYETSESILGMLHSQGV